MKRFALLFAVLLLVFALASCGQPAAQPEAPAPQPEAEQPAQQPLEDDAEPVLPVPDLGEGRQAVDAVAVDDGAFDLVSVVAFVGESRGYTHFAFVEADGTFQMCGVGAMPADDSKLEYLGNATVGMTLVDDQTGEDLYHTIAYSNDGQGNVNFELRDEQSADSEK